MQPIAPVLVADLLAPVQRLLYKFEVNDGTDWLDLCSLGGKCYVKKDGISFSLGGAGVSPEPIAASWSAEIHNEDGIFHPFHPTSEYADLFRIGREVRISLGGIFKKFPAPFEAWSNRKRINLPIPTANLTDFPEKVPIVAGTPESIAIGAKCRADGFDIRFTAADGVTELPYERESFAVAGGEASAIFWVKTDVATAGTYIWCYYGNPAASDGADPESVWDSNFKAVYHMKDATTSTILDSTGNDNDGAKKGANEPIEADGKIGKGQDFDGTDDYAVMPENGTLDISAQLTLEAWIYSHTNKNYGTILTKSLSYYFSRHSDGKLARYFYGTSVPGWRYSTGTVPLNEWTHVCYTYDGTKLVFYINGVASGGIDPLTGNIDIANEYLSLGVARYSGASYYPFDGLIDEPRVSSVARSAPWIAYEYANMNPADGGLTWGAEASPQVPNYPKLWRRLTGYMDAPRFDHGSRTVSLSGMDYMKRLADTIIRASPLDQEIINGPSHWGKRIVLSTSETEETLGSELYSHVDAVNIDPEMDTMDGWTAEDPTRLTSETEGGGGSTYVAQLTAQPSVYSNKAHIDGIGSLTANHKYKVNFKYRIISGTDDYTEFQFRIYKTGGETELMGGVAGLGSWEWATGTFYFVATSPGATRVWTRVYDISAAACGVQFDLLSIREVTSYVNTPYPMPEDCNGPYLAVLNGQEIWPGGIGPEGWLYDEQARLFYFDKEKYIEGGTDNLAVYYYTDQFLDNILADLLVTAGYYADRAAAISAMNYAPTGITIPRIWFESDTTALAAVKLICERADYRFWFDEEGTPYFQPNPSAGAPPPPAGNVYYVDATGGLDSNDGLSEGAPWETIAKVNAAVLSPDDQVLFKRGETWAEELKPTSAGTSGHPIIFGAYGVGVPPKITGATRCLDTNAKNYLTCRGIIFSGKEVLATGSTGTSLEYCLLRDSNANGFKALNAPSTALKNCLVIGSRDDGVLADGATAVIDLKNTIVVANGGGVYGSTYGGGGLNTANGGTINYSYSNVTGNGYRPDWNVRAGSGGTNNQLQVLPKMERAMKDAAFFTITIDDTGYAYAQAAAAAIAPYGGKLTFFVIPSLIDAAGETALAALAAAGHEVAVHSWTHADLTATKLFDVTSTNTNPTVDIDVATTTIVLWCDETGNRVTLDWSGNKTIANLNASVAGKGWTITKASTIENTLRLACMKDTTGAQAVPFAVLPDVAAPNYMFWNQEVNATRDWITAITGVTPKTMAYPYGQQNAALQAWLKDQGYEGARGTNDILQTLSSIELYNNRNGHNLKGDGSEVQVKDRAKHYFELSKQTARMLCFYVHNTGELSPTQWGWFAQELAAAGALLQTFGSYVSAIRASHTPDGAGLIYTKTYPDVSNFRLTPVSPCINAGFSTGLDEDIEGTPTPQAGDYDIGAYEFLMATPATPTFEDKDLQGCGFFQDLGTVRNRIVIEGIEQGMFAASEEKKQSRLAGEASDPSSIEAYLEKTHKITNHLFQDQASIDAMCIALLAEWAAPKDYASFDLFANPVPLELGDTIGLKLLLQKVGEVEYFADRAVIIRDVSIDGPRAGYKVEIIP